MKNDTNLNKLNGFSSVKANNNHHHIENKTSYNSLSLSYIPLKFSKSASQQNIHPKNDIIINKNIHGYLHLKEFENSLFLKNSFSYDKNNMQSNNLSKSYYSFVLPKNAPLLTSDMIYPYSNDSFNTIQQNNNNAHINRKSILPYLYRNLHEKKLINKNNKDLYKTHLHLLKQKNNQNDFHQKSSFNQKQNEELFLKNIYFNRNDYNLINNKMQVRFNKNSILKKKENNLNIKYNIYDGNYLKKNNSEMLMLLNQDINGTIGDNLLNSRSSKTIKNNIFRKKNRMNENKIKNMIKKVKDNILDLKNIDKQKNVLNNRNIDLQLNNCINNGKKKEIKVLLNNKKYFKKEKNENNFREEKNEDHKNSSSNDEQEKLFNTNQKYFFKFRKDIIEEPDLEEDTD